MASQKYSVLDHDAPEVVPKNDAPEVYQESPIYRPRTTSVDSPQVVENAYHHKASVNGSYGAADAAPASQSTGEAGILSEKGHENKNGRRYCGMRRPIFIAVIVIALLVVIGVVLGAVLGTVLSNKSGNGQPLEAVSMTGLATAVSGNTLYQYYQAPDGNIMENSYDNGDWSLQQGSNNKDVIVTSEAGVASPLAAIVYPHNGETYRQVFFISSSGKVTTTNRTESGTWSTPHAISGDVAVPGNIALAACWNNKFFNGIRVYYGVQNGFIQEVGGSFDGSDWSEDGYEGFAGSDVNAGVACAVYNQYLNIYYRSTHNGSIVQSFYDFSPTAKKGWFIGPLTQGHPAASNSDIAVCNDQYATEYVFWQLPNKQIMNGIVSPTGSKYEAYVQRQSAVAGSKLAAAFVDGGALVAFQNSSSDSTMWVSDVSRNGVAVFNEAIS